MRAPRKPDTRTAEASSADDTTAAKPNHPSGEVPAGAWIWHGPIIALVVWITFLNTLPNGFHLDDYYRVVGNPGIQKLWPLGRHFVDPGTSATAPHLVQFRPLLPLTLSINYAIGGDNLGGYHLGNLIFHIASSLLVYWLCLELLTHWSAWCHGERQRRQVALGVALIFGVHPVSGIPVNYICARDLLIMQCFLLACLLGYIRLRRLGGTVLRWALVLLALALALLGKTNAAAAPVVVLLFEFLVARVPIFSIKPWLRIAAFAAVVVGFFAYTKYVLDFSDFTNVVSSEHGPWWVYSLTQLRTHFSEYMRNFFWPFLIRQEPYVEPARSFLEPGVLLGTALLVATLATAWSVRRNAGLISFCILSYWALLIPEASVLPLYDLASYYRPYYASPFFYLIIGLLACRYVRPRVRLPAFWVLFAYFCAASIYLNTTWRTDYTLWSYSVKYGGKAVAHLNLGMSTSDLHARKRHLEDALRLAPNYVVAHIDLGLALIKLGHRNEGLAHLEKAVSLDPSQAQSHYWLSKAYSILGRKQDAARESAEAVRLHPRHFNYRLKAAEDAQSLGDYRGSLQYIRPVLQDNPHYGNALFLEGSAKQMTGDRDGAIASYRAFLDRNPDNCQAQFSLGFALMETGRYQEAIEHFERALSLKPSYDEARAHLQTCREKTSK